MKKTLTNYVLGGIATLGALIAPGCTRPVVENHKEFYGKFNPTDVNQGDSTYKAHILTVMGEEYFLHRTADGRIGMFKLAESTRIIDQPRNPLSKKNRKAEVRVVSGESLEGELGVYVLEKEKGENTLPDPFIDSVGLNTEGERPKKARINNPNRKGIELAVRKSTEQDCQYNLPTVNLPELGECYVVAAGKKFQKPGFYNFHVIPVQGSRLFIDKNGKIKIEHKNNIYRPTFNSNKKLEYLKAKADAEAAEKAKAAEAKRLADEKAEAERKAKEDKEKAEAERQRKGIPSTSEVEQN